MTPKRTTRIPVAALAAAVASLLACAALAWALFERRPGKLQPRREAPHILIDHEMVDLGTVTPGQTKDAVFEFVNLGRQPLRIENVVTSCGCADPVVSHETVEFGQRASLTVTYHAEKFGHVSHSIGFVTNDPNRPRVELSLKANCQPWVQAVPGSLFFGNVVGHTKVGRELDVFSPRGQRFRIRGVKSNVSGLSVDFAETEAVTHRLRVTLAAPQDSGKLVGEIQIDTSSEEQPQLLVPVDAQVVGMLTSRPTHLLLGKVSPGAEMAREIVLHSSAGVVPKLRSIACTDDRWTVTGQEVKAPGGEAELRVKLRLRVPREGGNHVAKLAICARAPEQQTVTVPLMVVVGDLE